MERRLVAIDENNPYPIPYLVIEFGVDGEPEQLFRRISEQIGHSGISFDEIPCVPRCRAFYVEFSEEVENRRLYRHHYFVRSKRLTWLISYLDDKGMAKGRNFTRDIVSQILESSTGE